MTPLEASLAVDATAAHGSARLNLQHLASMAHTLPRLGLTNLARVLLYRSARWGGWYRAIMPIGATYSGPFWQWPTASVSHFDAVDANTRATVTKAAEEIRSGRLTYFSRETRYVGFPPDWLRDPGNGTRSSLNHWTRVAEFGAGDIKQIWEASRFDALPVLAAAAAVLTRANDRIDALAGIEKWIGSWVNANPANAGPNWRCGQETALRLINTLVADRLMRSAGATHTAALERFVADHCVRVAATMPYAIAQDNNHASSEAVGLYIGGLWLDRRSGDAALRSRGRRWQRVGLANFIRSVRRLVLADGTFSQYSVNYHRLFLDTASLLELFRRDHGGALLPPDVHHRLAQAVRWLVFFTDAQTGDAPNLGANDGSRLLHIAGADYRDFRPHAQLAAALFCDARAWDHVPSANSLLNWFGVSPPASTLPPPTTTLFADGGYALLVRGDLRAYVRLPILSFRPGQSDLLHVDVWWRGRNVVRDGGTFSYNTESRWMTYFPGVASHSTVQFDGRDQMPRLSRFLFGRWPTAIGLQFDEANTWVSCAYRDWRGALHRRRVALTDDSVNIEDELDGVQAGTLRAVSRLRLQPFDWSAQGDGALTAKGVHVSGKADGCAPIVITGFESRHYGERSELPVMELAIATLPARAGWQLRFS